MLNVVQYVMRRKKVSLIFFFIALLTGLVGMALCYLFIQLNSTIYLSNSGLSNLFQVIIGMVWIQCVICRMFLPYFGHYGLTKTKLFTKGLT